VIVRTIADTLVTGLPYVLPVLGTYVLFRVLREIDLTIDASFVLGGAVTGVLLVRGTPAPAATLAGGLAGAAAGLLTAGIHQLIRIPVLLAGIISMIGLYSVNLRVMGSPSVGLAGADTLYAPFATWSRTGKDAGVIIVLAAVIATACVVIAGFLRTDAGLAMRAHGSAPLMARSNGVGAHVVVALGLALANGLAGFGGALVAQGQGFAEVNMGSGVVVAGVAGLLVGELLTRNRRGRVGVAVVAVVIGTIAYRLILVVALRAGLQATDMRLVTAIALAAAMLLHRVRAMPGVAA
jgi:putative ABC transport system permease protein